MRVVATLLLCAGAARAERPAPSWPEATLLAVAEASLVLDAMQTLDIKRHPTYGPDYAGQTGRGPYNMYEMNPILGQHPSDAVVVSYFTGTAIATAAVWYVLPSRWRVIAPLLVMAVEIPVIGHNAHVGLTMRL